MKKAQEANELNPAIGPSCYITARPVTCGPVKCSVSFPEYVQRLSGSRVSGFRDAISGCYLGERKSPGNSISRYL